MQVLKDISDDERASDTRQAIQASVAQWLSLQRSLASSLDLSLATLDGDDSVLGIVENNNSICQTMGASSEYGGRCKSDCGQAWSKSSTSKKVAEFQCHAGLHCFVIPARINEIDLVVLGGRVFTSAKAYTRCVEKYAELSDGGAEHFLADVKFKCPSDLQETESLVVASLSAQSVPPTVNTSLRQLLNAHRYGEPRAGDLEVIRTGSGAWQNRRTAEKLQEILRHVADALDPRAVYEYVLAKVSELMKAARSSLMILNEESNELTVEATIGFSADLNGPIRAKLGETVAGVVLARGTPMIVSDVERDERLPRVKRSDYKTKSFISFPIVVGARKLGVINLTHRTDGVEYGADDLPMVQQIAPHLALVIDRAEWRRKAEQFQQMSLTDALTGLPNRRYLEERLFEEVERSKRHDTPLSFMIIDIDRFKRYNDLFGHTNADRVLVKTAQMLRRGVRAIDMPARFAGDEFCIILPETEIEHARIIAERLRREASNTAVSSEQGETMGRVTISIGLSGFGGSRQSPLAIIESGDRALYQAKTRGRNCVVAYEGEASR